MKSEDVQALAVKAQKGDLNAFSDLINHFQSPLLRYISQISNISYEQSEEVLQESFLKAWRYIKDYDSSFSFSTWMYRIVHQMTISEHRKLVSRGEEQRIAWDDEWMNNIAGEMDIERDLLSEETGKMVRSALNKVPQKYREVLVLRFLEEKSYEEISDILQVPVGSAGSLVSRAKKQLKSIVEKEPSFQKNSL